MKKKERKVKVQPEAKAGPKRERKRLNGAADIHGDDDPIAVLPKGRNSPIVEKPDPEVTAGADRDRVANSMFATYKPEFVGRVKRLVLHGATIRDIVVHFQISRRVLGMWCAYYPEFAAAMTITREASLADQKVVRSLYELTQPRKVTREKVFMVEGEAKVAKYKENVGPDINAIKFWLMNRDPMTWSKNGEGSGGADAPNKLPSQININLIKNMNSEQLRTTIALLHSIMTPNTGLKRLDAVDAETEAIEKEPPNVE